MSKITLVLGHPDPSGQHLCIAIADACREGAEAKSHQVTVIDVAGQNIPFLRSREEWEATDLPPVVIVGQSAIKTADHVVFVYPLWIGDVPTLLKAWTVQILRKCFAFELDGIKWHPALKGTSARVIVTMGMPGFAYRWFYMAHSLRSLDRNILKFCGIRPVWWSHCGNADDPSGKTQKKFLAKVRKLGARALYWRHTHVK